MIFKNIDAIPSFATFFRTKEWLHILGLAVLGIAFHSEFDLFTHNALLGLIVSSLYLAHGFSLNNYFDIRIDRPIKKGGFSLNYPLHKKLLLCSCALFLVNCVLSFQISPIVLYLVIIGGILGVAYSAPPLRLKKMTFLNILLNSAGFSVIFLIGFVSVNNSVTLHSLMMAILFALVFIPLQIMHQISHSEADKIQNIQTIYNRYGLKKTLFYFDLSLVLLVLWSLLLSILNDRYDYIFYSTFLFGFSLFYALHRMKNDKIAESGYATKTRLLFRKICILYGIILLFIFFFA